MQQIKFLEEGRRQTVVEEDGVVTSAPVFTVPVKNLELVENQVAHFEARVIPVGDPSMKVEWFRNGVALEHGKYHYKLGRGWTITDGF